MTLANGSCLCGATKFVTKNISTKVGACHCSTCRKWGGGPWMAVDCGRDVVFDSKETIAIYNSSEWAERGFCRLCGSHLFYRLKGSGQYMMPLGLFGEVEGLIFEHQVFIDEKPSFYCFSNETADLTGQEVFAKYAPLE